MSRVGKRATRILMTIIALCLFLIAGLGQSLGSGIDCIRRAVPEAGQV